MTAFARGDLAIGGQHEYTEIKNQSGAHVQMIHVTDLLTGAGAQTYVMGVTFRTATGDLYAVSTPDVTMANCPHDVDNFPNDSGVLVAVVESSGVLKFKKYGYDGTPTGDVWTPAVEATFAQQPVKISIACDSDTVFYTSQLFKIKRYSLANGQLSDYETLAADSPYRYGGLRVLPGGSGDTRQVVVAMTQTGDGPFRAVCLAADGTTLWTDEINPSGNYRILHYYLTDQNADQIGDFIEGQDTQADEAATNDLTLSLACYYNPCGAPRVWGTVIGGLAALGGAVLAALRACVLG